MEKVTKLNLNSNQKNILSAEVKKIVSHLEREFPEGIKRSLQAMSKGNLLAVNQGRSFGINELKSLCQSIENNILAEQLPVGINPVSARDREKSPYQLPTHSIVNENINVKPNFVELIRKMNSTNKKICTLIIDDDVDSLIPVDSIFRKYGCKTEQAMNYLDACQKIKETQADIIILDWRIGELTGGQLIEQCSRAIAMSSNLKNKFLKKPIKIVTYSGDDLSGITFSKQASQFFTYLGQWNKQNMFSEIEAKAVQLMVS